MEVLATFHILKMPPSWSRRDMILFLLQEEMIQMSYTTFSLHLALYDWEFVQTLDYEALEMYQPLGFPRQTRWCNINQEPHYHSKRSKASTLRSPALGYIHALLCKTLTWRRKSMTTVSVADFLYLCAMTEHLLYPYGRPSLSQCSIRPPTHYMKNRKRKQNFPLLITNFLLL